MKWYSDQYAEAVYREMKSAVERAVGQMMSGHELSHFGINRNDETGEVRLVLHMNPVGSVKVRPGVAQEQRLENAG